MYKIHGSNNRVVARADDLDEALNEARRQGGYVVDSKGRHYEPHGSSKVAWSNPKKVQYDVHSGRPSWHQSRAGHISSGVTVFDNRKDAEEYVRNLKKHHPDDPAFIIERPLTTNPRKKRSSGNYSGDNLKFTMEIHLGNDAVQTYDDLHNILRFVQRPSGMPLEEGQGNIYDVNGNLIGNWKIK